MGLGAYIKKRRFNQTPEPKGAHKSSPSKKLSFVVQEHHASSLHYDFRLEIDGVLKSWAVPKGPSMNPHDKHLAVMTEDHPFEYRKFEGVIPEGNYGAGNVIIWDKGWYEARASGGKNSEKVLRKELKKGHLTFVLHGEKLRGEFALIKMHGPQASEKTWLLVKKSDGFASGAEVTKQDESVISHKHVDDLGAHNKLPPSLAKYPKITKPWHIKPMLCTLVDEPFSRDSWLFEIKWDGYRAIGTKYKNDVQLYSRNALNFYQKYPPIAEAMHQFTQDVIVDGEIVVVDSDGVPHFERLQSWQHNPQGDLHYYIFDILWCDGRDLRSMPLAERKEILKIVLPQNDVLRFSDDIDTQGEKLFKEMQRRGLEGMVAKRASSPYREEVRGPDWLKIKTHMRQEVVIGGYTEPRGGRKYLGSLLVGLYENGEFVYAGHSGGGIPDAQRKELQQKLAAIERSTSPFNKEPTPNAPVHWVKPKLVCEMSFSEWTSDGYMRHPAFAGMRADKNPKSVHKEKPKHMSAEQNKTGSDLELTHLSKVFFPKHKYTKGDVINYYTAVASYILPYLKDRPCSMNRMPGGVTGESFYQKNNEHLPAWVPSADIFSDSNNANLHWLVGGDLKTLHYMVQLGCIEINPWNSRVKTLEKPDWAVIDLDPDGVNFKKVIEVAQTVKQVCDEWGIPTYPKTSGKTGIHIFIPLGAKYSYEQCRNLAHLIVIETNKRQPTITSIERNPAHRKHKIYLDYLQNSAGQTLASPYSVRPTPDASVSAPLHWDEVKPGLLPSNFTIKNMPARLKRVGDIWKPVLGEGIDLPLTLNRIELAIGATITENNKE